MDEKSFYRKLLLTGGDDAKCLSLNFNLSLVVHVTLSPDKPFDTHTPSGRQINIRSWIHNLQHLMDYTNKWKKWVLKVKDIKVCDHRSWVNVFS